MSTVNELRLTKKRLQNLRVRRLGLQQLAVREISKQLTFYRTHPDELKKLKILPALLREKILQVLMKKRCLDEQGQETEFENLNEIFPLLLSPRTHFIELNGILSFCPDRYKDGKIEKVTQWCVELLKQIETRAPQVETLVINRNNQFYIEHGNFRNFINFDDAEFNQEMVESVMKMQRLKRLNVSSYFFQLPDLLKICKNLPRLQYINVVLLDFKGNELPGPEEVSSSFCNLKELIFEFHSYDNDWLGTLCTRYLPKIEVLQYDPNQMTEWIGIKKYSNFIYLSLNFPGASNLRNICLDEKYYRAEEIEKKYAIFPKASCLMVKNPQYPEKNMTIKFDNISQLHLLNYTRSGDFETYLNTYGQMLQSLYLGHGYKIITIDLEAIFKLCPKLEKLSLLNVEIKTPSSNMDFFAELKELEWANNHPHGIPADQEDEDLANFLSAPKLEKVKLQSTNFNQMVFLKLNALIRENRILNNLHTLHVGFSSSFPEALAIFLNSACAFLPKLTDFKFGYREQCADPLLTCQSTPLCDFDASVCALNAVFENEN